MANVSSLSLCIFASSCMCFFLCFFFFNDTATTEIYTLSLHDALPISTRRKSKETSSGRRSRPSSRTSRRTKRRSEEHTSELQSRLHLVCRLLLEKKKKRTTHPRSWRNQDIMNQASDVACRGSQYRRSL